MICLFVCLFETDLKLTAEKNMIMLINYYFPLFCIVILLYLQFAEFSEKLFCFGSGTFFTGELT